MSAETQSVYSSVSAKKVEIISTVIYTIITWKFDTYDTDSDSEVSVIYFFFL